LFKISLISIHLEKSSQSLPLANAFLVAAIKNSPQLSKLVDVSIIDLYSDTPDKEGIETIAATTPDLIGFSTYIWNREKAGKLIKALKNRLPKIIICAGGPEVTADPEGTLKEYNCDFVVVGEGETSLIKALHRIINNEKITDLPGIGTLQQSEITLLPGVQEDNLDLIPSPYISGILKPEKYTGLLWQLSRGCSFACDFCFDSKEQKSVRKFSLERIEEELKWMSDNKISQVFVLDSTFNLDMKRAKIILGMIQKIAPDTHFHFEARSEFIDDELAFLFSSLKCSLQIGLQSSNPEILKNVKRIFNPEEFVNNIALLNDTGAIFGFDLIYGLPGDSYNGFRDSLNFALSLFPNHIDIFPMAVLPGTPLYQRKELLNLRSQNYPPYKLIESSTFSEEDMEKAEKLAVACDIFYSRGRAVAWFQPVIEAVGLTPVELLEAFQGWLYNGSGELSDKFSDEEIWQLQRKFVQELFLENRKELSDIALDIIDYNYYYTSALVSPPSPLFADDEINAISVLKLPLAVSSSAKLGAFHYELVEIIENQGFNLEEFSKYFVNSPSWGVIYPKDGEILTESFPKPYFDLLCQLDGKKKAGDIAAKVGISAEEAIAFLEFAFAEGIITKV